MSDLLTGKEFERYMDELLVPLAPLLTRKIGEALDRLIAHNEALQAEVERYKREMPTMEWQKLTMDRITHLESHLEAAEKVCKLDVRYRDYFDDNGTSASCEGLDKLGDERDAALTEWEKVRDE